MSKPWQFQKGNRANPNGRPKGVKTKLAAQLDNVADEQIEAVVKNVCYLARRGNMKAAALILNRRWPARKGGRPIEIELPKITTAEDVPVALSAVAAAVADGRLNTTEGAELGMLIEAARRGLEMVELTHRIERLEAQQNK